MARRKQQPFDRSSCMAHYLQSWKEDRAAWKFNKKLQTSLIATALDAEKLPETLFPLACEYLASVSGTGARRRIDESVEARQDTPRAKAIKRALLKRREPAPLPSSQSQ